MFQLKNIPGDRTLWCRHEYKYLISEVQAAAIAEYIRPYMKLDRYSELKEGNAYPICSLYLDNDSLKLYRETMTGVKNRFKLRIRSYTDDPETPRFFEIKRRVNRIIIKSRARVMTDSVAAIVAGQIRPPQDNSIETQALYQFLLYKNTINAKPVVRVRYMRQAFESFTNDSIRITFDRKLSSNVTQNLDMSLGGSGWLTLPLPGVILEIKFTGRFPAWLSRMVKTLGIEARSVSKYGICVQQLFNVRYCTPIINTRNDLWKQSVNFSKKTLPCEVTSRPRASSSPYYSPSSSDRSSPGFTTPPTADSRTRERSSSP